MAFESTTVKQQHRYQMTTITRACSVLPSMELQLPLVEAVSPGSLTALRIQDRSDTIAPPTVAIGIAAS